MKLRKINIKKFRSIEKAELNLNEINAIVGQNNSGKSAIIRALNCFFNYNQEEYNFIKGIHSYNNQTTSILELTFFSNELLSSKLDPYFINNIITIQMIFRLSSKKRTLKIKKVDNIYESIDESFIDELKNFITFIYIPPIRNIEDIKWEESTLLKELVEEYIKKETQRRDNITPKFKKATDYLEDNTLKKITNSMKELYSLNDDINYKLSFNQDSKVLNFINNLQLSIIENEKIFNLAECGTGIQSLTIIALHRILAKLRHKNIILGLEEPETNLHPQAQRELISSIKGYTSDSELSQVILTTHSTILIDNIEHQDISLVRKIKDSQRGFKSTVTKINKDFFTQYGIQSFNYYQYHHYRNSDFFYAKKIIITESKNDAEVVKHLAKRENIDLDLLGVSIINLEGVNNLNYPFYLIKELEIPYILILDKDYFLPYINEKLDESRGKSGLPKYLYEFKNGTVLNDIMPRATDRDLFLSLLETNHTEALNHSINFNLIVMNYNLEMDLTCSNKSVEIYSDILQLTGLNRTQKFLLENRGTAIKKINNILNVLENLNNNNLPVSYKRIRKMLKDLNS